MRKGLLLCLAVALVATACCNRRSADYSWEEDLAFRESYDFTWTYDKVKAYIQKYIPNVTDEQIEYWTENGPLEAKVINGERLYYKRTAAGLFLVDPECRAIKEAATQPAAQDTALNGTIVQVSTGHEAEIEQMRTIIASVKETGNPLAMPVRMKCRYTITVDADAVPAGEIVRCWLPFPRKDVARQQDVKFLGASEAKCQFSKPSCAHSSLYMEKKAVAGEPTVFWDEFEFTSYGEWHKITPDMVQPYDKNSKLYKENTAERDFHMAFSDRLRNLADSLTAGLDNPYEQTKAIFSYIRRVYPWSGAREYSTLENIPEYVLDSGHGDCGQVTLLLMTLLRIKGIPCHWQSGLVTDDGWNLHDWCEVYFEGVGWVPVDQSAGIRSFAWDEDSKYFYLGGCDPYRLILNQDYGCEMSPKKIYPRSETVDFQRGEVEWKGGNLYFNAWSADMDVEFL